MRQYNRSHVRRFSPLQKQSVHVYVEKLKLACDWLSIEQGRATEYIRLLEESDRAKPPTSEHILAYYESFDIVELFELWEGRIAEFPGLKSKIRAACGSGPILSDDENPSKSNNKQRNDAFEFVLSGKLLAAGVRIISVDGTYQCGMAGNSKADISFDWNGGSFDIECKRVYSGRLLPRRAKEARKQIFGRQHRGIIAIDCSVLYRPKGTVLETSSPSHAAAEASKWLEESIEPEIRKSLRPKILGFILFSRLPAMTATEIVNSNEEYYRRRDCLSSTLVVGNPRCCDINALQHIYHGLKKKSMVTQKGL